MTRTSAPELRERLRRDGHARAADLAGTNLRRADLRGADLRGADLKGADLSRADLEGADLGEADLKGADLRAARLVRAKLPGARLEEALVDRADLTGTDLTGATLGAADLSNTLLDGTVLDGAALAEANLERVRLRNVTFRGARMAQARLTEAQVEGGDLTGADLTGADLEMARLEDVVADGVVLAGARLRSALLRKGSWKGADLRRAEMERATIEDLSLTGADLRDAVLDGADLHGIDWSDARLDGASLKAVRGLAAASRGELAARGALVTAPLSRRIVERAWGSRWGRTAAAAVVAGAAGGLAWLVFAPENQTIETLLTRADAAVQAGEGGEAIRLFDIALGKVPADSGERVPLLLQKAAACERLADLGAAKEAYLAAARLAGAKPEADAPGAYADFLARQGAHRDRLDFALTLVSRRDDAWLRLTGLVIASAASRDLGRTSDARTHAVEALAALRALPEREPEMALRVADALAAAGEGAEAAALLDEVGAAAGADGATAFEAARILWEGGRKEDALAAWTALEDRTRAADPATFAEARQSRIDGLADLQRWDEALALAEELVRATDEQAAAAGASRVAGLRERRGDPGGAETAWTDLARRFPGQRFASALGRASLRQGQGDLDGALALIAEARPLASGDEQILQVEQQRVATLQAASRPAEALAALDELVRRFPGRNELAGPLVLARADALRAGGDLDGALRALRGAAESGPDPETRRQARFGAVDLLRQAGRAGEAADEAVALAGTLPPGDPERLRALLAAVDARGAARDWPGAVRDAETALAEARAPAPRAMAVRTLVETALSAGQPADASRWLTAAEAEGLSEQADVQWARLAWAGQLERDRQPGPALRICDALAGSALPGELVVEVWSRRVALNAALGRARVADALLADPPPGAEAGAARCQGPYDVARRLAQAGQGAAAADAYDRFLTACTEASFLRDNLQTVADDLTDARVPDRAARLLGDRLAAWKAKPEVAAVAEMSLGGLAQNAGRNDEALARFRSAAALAGEGSERGSQARMREADLLQGMGKVDEAAALYERVGRAAGAEPGTRANAWTNLGRVRRQKKDAPGARAALAEARKGLTDRYALAWLELEAGDTERDAGDAALATRVYEGVRKSFADVPDAVFQAGMNLAGLQAERGDARARAATLEALARGAPTPEQQVQAWDALGHARWDAGDKAGAEKAWDQVASREGRVAGAARQALTSRANRMRGDGRYADAQALYQGALARKPDPEWRSLLLQSIADTLREAGDTRRAAAAYRRVLAEHPGTEAAANAQGALRDLGG